MYERSAQSYLGAGQLNIRTPRAWSVWLGSIRLVFHRLLSIEVRFSADLARNFPVASKWSPRISRKCCVKRSKTPFVIRRTRQNTASLLHMPRLLLLLRLHLRDHQSLIHNPRKLSSHIAIQDQHLAADRSSRVPLRIRKRRTRIRSTGPSSSKRRRNL